jgi:hypothetical protein
VTTKGDGFRSNYGKIGTLRANTDRLVHAQVRNDTSEFEGKNVTSPKGLQGWKHRFAVNRRHSYRFARTAGTQPLRFGSIGLRGVPIGRIPLQSGNRLWIGKPKKSNGAGCASGSGGVETRPFCPVLQSYGSTFANLSVK